MARAVLETRGLVKRYGSVHALGPLDVEIPEGSWGLLGPNGAGKTTLIRLLLGLTRATEGNAMVMGLDPAEAPLEVRTRVGFVPERDAYVPGLSGIQYVAYAGRLAGLPEDDAKQRAHEVLNFVGLEEERYRDVADYSQGMRQRAKLAQAIVHAPELLLLDEPTNGLDPEGREEMLALVKSLAHDHGITTLLASHILPDVEEVCDGALLLDNGQPVLNATIQELSAVEEQVYLVRIRGSAQDLEGALAQHEASLQTTPTGLLRVHVPGQAGPSLILTAAEAAGVQVRHLEPARESLEETLLAKLEEGTA